MCPWNKKEQAILALVFAVLLLIVVAQIFRIQHQSLPTTRKDANSQL
jgi:hypothetical protein